MENLEMLVKELCHQPAETQWLEFKRDNYDFDIIGKDISALANGAALSKHPQAYMVWGVDDKTHKIVGTTHDLKTLKKGNEEIESWLRNKLSSNADFSFNSIIIDDNKINILIIQKALTFPVAFEKVEYIRVGSYTKPLAGFPPLANKLREQLRNIDFEAQIAIMDLELNRALHTLDYPKYFERTGIPIPFDATKISHYLTEDRLLIQQDNGLFSITNLGAVLLAKQLSDFPSIFRKKVRVVQYIDKSRLKIAKDEEWNEGYAICFENVIKYIEALIPSEEPIEGAVRVKHTAYPMIAIREAIGNALIHQDYSIRGSGPVIEIFSNRIEITNPGTLLVEPNRIIDNPPRSRNERLSDQMRRMKFCEELGSGWDKIVTACELEQLPAPTISLYPESTKVTFFAEIPFASIPKEERLWGCYLHACIKYIRGEQMTNTSLRERFGLETSSSGMISRLIRDAQKMKFIKPFDPSTAPRYMSYLPFWA